MYSPYRLVQFVRISNIYSCCFIVNCTRNHVITNTNRPFSGADPGICGTGETNFDSETNFEIRGEKAPCHLQFIKNFSFFPSLSFDEPDQVNTVRPNCSFLEQITFVVNLFQLSILFTSRMRNKKICLLITRKKHGKDNTWSFSNFGSKRKGSVPVEDISPSLSYF